MYTTIIRYDEQQHEYDYIPQNQRETDLCTKAIAVLLAALVSILGFVVGFALNIVIVPIFLFVFLLCMVPYFCISKIVTQRRTPRWMSFN